MSLGLGSTFGRVSNPQQPFDLGQATGPAGSSGTLTPNQPLAGLAQSPFTPTPVDYTAGNPAPSGTPFLQQDSYQQGFYDQGDYTTPGFGERGAQGLFSSQIGQTGAGNTAQQYSQQFQGQIGQDPGLGAYYDRAKTRLGSDMAQQQAARGAYGSSVALGMTGDALAGLEAERANREADYMLQQQALGGQLAGQAAESQLGWTQGLGGLGLASDAAQRGRLGLGMGAAGAAEMGAMGRHGQAFDEIYGLTGLASGSIGAAQQGALTSDMERFEAAMAARYGYGTELFNVAMAEVDASNQQRGQIASMAGNVFGGFL